MPKGYWIAQVDVADPEAYKAYVAAAAPAFARAGARFLARGGRSEAVEGRARKRLVVIEFPDYETALACWRSADYAAARRLRLAVSEGDIAIVEGYDGPQPGAG
jgi:uncharacterized protein (DUF1330 family)